MSKVSVDSKICIIIPYFGEWPFWMPFFLKSCKFNPDVNWLLIGDCSPREKLPSNVKYLQTSFEEYCRKVSEKLGIDFRPKRPYKLCDLKPALGYIHEEDIRGFDFWGFGDLDVVYGQLREYFDAEKLASYDLFSTHSRRVSGHLCLLRNNARMRNAFWKIRNFRERLCDQTHHALDEGGFSRIFLWRKNFPTPLFHFVGRFNPWRRKAVFEELYSTPNAGKPWVDGGRDFPATWYWHKGNLTTSNTSGRRFPYFHFYGWKKWSWDMRCPPSYQKSKIISERDFWCVDCNGFHSLLDKDSFS